MVSARKLLTEAIVELMEAETIENISVEKILKRGNVSRATFYKYYDDKYDLAASFFSGYLARLRDAGQPGLSSVFASMLTFMLRHKGFFANAFKSDGQNSLIEAMRAQLVDLLAGLVLERKGAPYLSLQENVAVRFAVSGSLQVIRQWIAAGPRETPEEMGRLLYGCLPAVLTDNFRAN